MVISAEHRKTRNISAQKQKMHERKNKKKTKEKNCEKKLILR